MPVVERPERSFLKVPLKHRAIRPKHLALAVLKILQEVPNVEIPVGVELPAEARDSVLEVVRLDHVVVAVDEADYAVLLLVVFAELALGPIKHQIAAHIVLRRLLVHQEAICELHEVPVIILKHHRFSVADILAQKIDLEWTQVPPRIERLHLAEVKIYLGLLSEHLFDSQLHYCYLLLPNTFAANILALLILRHRRHVLPLQNLRVSIGLLAQKLRGCYLLILQITLKEFRELRRVLRRYASGLRGAQNKGWSGFRIFAFSLSRIKHLHIIVPDFSTLTH